MITLKFYRDDEYVYINNPNGTTKQMSIEDFFSVFDVDTSVLPAYTLSDAGKILTVNNAGTGLEWGESGGVDYLYPVTITYDETTDSFTLDKTYNEILGAFNAGKYVIGIGDIEGYTGARSYNSATNVLYIQFLTYRILDDSIPSNPRIEVTGLQISPDGTITNIKTA